MHHLRLSKKNAPQSEYKKLMLSGKKYHIITNEHFYFCSFCHKCQKPLFYTLCLLRHRSLPYLCTACFALPRLRPFSFVLSACRLYRHAESPSTDGLYLYLFEKFIFTFRASNLYFANSLGYTDACLAFFTSKIFMSSSVGKSISFYLKP